MKILVEKPPVWQRVIATFDLKGKKPIFCYGDTIYNPFGGYIDDALIVHESVHKRQQGDDPESWWNRYLEDPLFRYEQELEAYREQYRFGKTFYERNTLPRMVTMWAHDLSSPMYGSIVTFADALRDIKK